MKRRLACMTGLLLLCLQPVVSFAADAEEAARLYQAEQWSEAATAYQAVIETQPQNAQAHYRLAVALRHLGRYDEAGVELDQAAVAGVPPSFAEAERARLEAAAGDGPGAIAALTRAAEAGFANPAAITGDAALAALADQPGFEAALARISKNAAPCQMDPTFRQFDFWVGDWEVKGADGTVYGHNRIDNEEHGCVLVEHWTGSTGNTGQSINFYDAHAGEWVQVWNGLGIQIEMRGGLEQGSMVLTGEIHYLASGDHRRFRGTWTPLDGGVVRQFFEESSDGGASWATWFEGFYHPAKTQAPEAPILEP